VRKKPSRKSFRVGIDARLAYRRGVGTYAANLILSLAKVDRRNEYFLFNAPELLRKKISNRRFHWVDLPFSNAAHYEQVLFPRAAVRAGVDFLHYVDNSATLVGDLPFVLTLHDTMYTRPFAEVRNDPTLRQRLVDAYKKWSVPRSAQVANAIITVSEFSREQIVTEIGVDPRKVTVIHEGVDRKFFKRSSRRKSGKIFKILAQGAADKRKNLSNILKAAKFLAESEKNFQLVVLGMDEPELRGSHYLREAMELDLGPRVEWAGNVPSEMLNQVYSEVDLFLYPSLMEGFGLPLLEAFACGVPVITSNGTSLPEVAGNAALFVDPKSPRAIAEAMRKVMKKPALRRQLIQRGLKRAKLFSWDKMAKLTLKVYERMEI
jgi:glycosyltransferase involved in cell wall biosynthesis